MLLVEFYDHSYESGTEGTDPILCRVVGVLTHETDLYLKLAVWQILAGCSDEDKLANEDGYKILKSTIVRKAVLIEAP
jgi:hypothetical protein